MLGTVFKRIMATLWFFIIALCDLFIYLGSLTTWAPYLIFSISWTVVSILCSPLYTSINGRQPFLQKKEWFLITAVHTILTNTNNAGINLPNGFAKALAHNNSCSRQNHEVCTFPFSDTNSLRASSPIWVSEVSLARTRERGAPRGLAARSRVLARLASLAQIEELARRLRH